MNFIITFIAADSALGRFSIQDLSDQERLALLMQSILEGPRESEIVPPVFTENGDFKYFGAWRGLWTHYGSTGSARKIEWWQCAWLFGLQQFNFDLLPPNLDSLLLREDHIGGAVVAAHLPRTLRSMHLSRNAFKGSISFQDLSETLDECHLYRNSFSGSVLLEHLPKSLKILHIGSNKFSGGIDLSKIQIGVRKLFMGDNRFTGGLYPEDAPESLIFLDVSENGITGLDREALPYWVKIE